jgi:hypothetical protein
MTEAQTDERTAALAGWLEENEEDMPSPAAYDEADYGRYMILTDKEADERARDYISESLWAFNASFLVSYLPDGVTEEVIEALQPQCEGANEAIRSMIGDRFDDLVSDAILSDGRGHFLNTYDGHEHEHEREGRYWYIYRIS